jgi:hypothetical protein
MLAPTNQIARILCPLDQRSVKCPWVFQILAFRIGGLNYTFGFQPLGSSYKDLKILKLERRVLTISFTHKIDQFQYMVR